jgi:tRNA-intron endonuclease
MITLKTSGELIGSRIVVWDVEEANRLYRLGFYGKPVGIPKPKPEQEFKAPLTLDVMEAIYLLDKKEMDVRSPNDGKVVKKKTLLGKAVKLYANFEGSYMIYKDLRDKGYVVTPGIKFGSDFAVYERGPGIDHAPFIISVKSKKESMGPFEIVRAGRLATTVRKQFIIAYQSNKRGKIGYLIFKWFKA